MNVEIDDLTPSQREVFSTTEPRILVLGGPGSGKTAVALWKGRTILEGEGRSSARRVLFLSFSRAATTEVATRAVGVLRGPLGRRIDMQTFHAFALGVIEGYRRYVGGGTEPVRIRTREEEKLGLSRPGSVRLDDILPLCLEIFGAAPWIQERYVARYAAVICDEFQDSSDSQVDLLELLGRESRIICLADPYQEIYASFVAGTRRDRIDRFARTGVRVFRLGDGSHRDRSMVIPRAAEAVRERRFDNEAIDVACREGRLRRSIIRERDDPHAVLVDELRNSRAAGARTIGVFLRTNAAVAEFAERLRSEGIEHEIVGLDSAAGEAQTAVAAIAAHVTGDGGWDGVLEHLALFQTATSRKVDPPPLALQLLAGQQALERELWARLETSREHFEAMAGDAMLPFLLAAREFWPTNFTSGHRLWRRGVDDLIGITLPRAMAPLNGSSASLLRRTAEIRRSASIVDALPGSRTPIRLMTMHQCKGREMDAVILANLPREREPRAADWSATSRLHFVDLTRARTLATVVVPERPNSFLAPYLTLCG